MSPLSYPVALDYLLSLPSSSSSSTVPTTRLPLLQTLSRSCPHPIHTPSPGLPPFDNSAMDGYLLDPALVQSASKTAGVLLRVKGSLAAGDRPLSASTASSSGQADVEGTERVGQEEVRGDCWEMMTGAPFPEGQAFESWGCVKHEILEVVEGGKYVRIVEPVRERANRRPAGEDYPPSSLVLPSHTLITPEHIMVLSSLGITHLDVLRPLRIGIISTGKELVSTPSPTTPFSSSASLTSPPLELARGQIFDSNTPYLTAKLASWGFDPVSLGSTGDSIEAFDTLLAKHAFPPFASSQAPSEEHLDMIITTGAVSQGRHDHVPSSLARLGVEVGFKGVAMRPGGPVMFGRFPKKRPVPSSQGEEGAAEKEEGDHSAKIRLVEWPPRSPSILQTATQQPTSSDIPFHPSDSLGIPIFALPGNPQAVAATLRFLALPYLLHFSSSAVSSANFASDLASSPSESLSPSSSSSHPLTTPLLRTFVSSSSSSSHLPSSSSSKTVSVLNGCGFAAAPSSSSLNPPRRLPTRFFPGRLLPANADGNLCVELTKGKAGSGMMSGLVGKDRCWVSFQEGIKEEEMVGLQVKCWVV